MDSANAPERVRVSCSRLRLVGHYRRGPLLIRTCRAGGRERGTGQVDSPMEAGARVNTSIRAVVARASRSASTSIAGERPGAAWSAPQAAFVRVFHSSMRIPARAVASLMLAGWTCSGGFCRSVACGHGPTPVAESAAADVCPLLGKAGFGRLET